MSFGNPQLMELQQIRSELQELNEKVDRIGPLVADTVNALREIRDELRSRPGRYR